MYGEYFDVLQPDQIILTSWFEEGRHLEVELPIKEDRVKYSILAPDPKVIPIIIIK